jgi:intracellular septation protein
MPIAIFFIVFKTTDIYWATGAGIIAYSIQVYISYKQGKATKTEYVTLAMFVFFGSLTIIFQSEAFIQWKFTIISFLFGILLVGSKLFFNTNLMQKFFESVTETASKDADDKDKIELNVSDKGYLIINNIWAFSFFFKGIANYYIFTNYTLDEWVNFKTFALPIFTIVLMAISGIIIYKYNNIQENKINEQ